MIHTYTLYSVEGVFTECISGSDIECCRRGEGENDNEDDEGMMELDTNSKEA